MTCLIMECCAARKWEN